MPFADVTYFPGTQKDPQQSEITQRTFTDTDKVHFPDGRLSTLPPYFTTALNSDNVELLGGVRSIWAHTYTQSFAGNYFLHGSNTRLYVANQSNLYNITPFAGQKSETLATDPLSVASGDATLTITWVAHGLAVGDFLRIGGAAAIGGLTSGDINTDFLVATVPDSDTITVEMGVNASSTETGGGSGITALAIESIANLSTDPLSVTSGDETVTVTYTAHGLSVGDRIKIEGVDAAVGGIPLSELTGELIVNTVPDVNSFTFEATTAASSTTTGGGSGIYTFEQIVAGNLDQDAASGYGVGLYGEGVYGQGGPAVVAQEFPRIWSFADFGDNVVMCPGDYTAGDGQKIYLWDGDLSQAPTILPNAPTDCNWVDVFNNHIVALNERRIDIAAIGSTSDWTGLSSYTQEVQRATRLISSQVLNEKEGCIFTPNFVLRLRFVGGQDIWDLSDLFLDDGLIAPNAVCLLDSVIYWRGSRGSYRHDGSIPNRIKNIMNDEFVLERINDGQVWKSFAFSDPENSEWYFYYPIDDDNEPTQYMIHNVIGFEGAPQGSFTLGSMDRTAAQKPGQLDSVFYMANATSESVAGTSVLHFAKGPVTFDWSATTSETYLVNGEYRALINQVYPDSNQGGNVTMTVNTREYPQGTLNVSQSYTVAPTDRWVTVRNAGKLAGFTWSGNVQFTIGSWKVNLRQLGRRGR